MYARALAARGRVCLASWWYAAYVRSPCAILRAGLECTLRHRICVVLRTELACTPLHRTFAILQVELARAANCG
eukprot:3493601-Alexandrium_andersonii.AAC.1